MIGMTNVNHHLKRTPRSAVHHIDLARTKNLPHKACPTKWHLGIMGLDTLLHGVYIYVSSRYLASSSTGVLTRTWDTGGGGTGGNAAAFD